MSGQEGVAKVDVRDVCADANALGDDNAGTPDDEDGVTFGTAEIGAGGGSVVVNVQGAPVEGALLDAWIDFDADGVWGGGYEQIADSLTVFNGDNVVLRIWFDDTQGNGVHQLTPDHVLTSAGYSYHALVAENASFAATAGDADTVDAMHGADL